MNISSLIRKSQKIKKEHGDLHVIREDSKTWPDHKEPDLEKVDVVRFAGKKYLLLR